MPIYKKDPPGVAEVVNRMVELYHGALQDAGVQIDILEARVATDENGDSEGVALKLHGYPCAATMAIVSYKNRVLGGGDALLTIDGEEWEVLSQEEREALIDHELEHLELRTDRDNLLIRDDLGRPKLNIRKHDHQFGWFDSVARRHGAASMETKQLKAFNVAHQQLWLPFETASEAAADSRNNRPVRTGVAEEGEEAEFNSDADEATDAEREAVNKAADKAMKAVKKRQTVKGTRGGVRKREHAGV